MNDQHWQLAWDLYVHASGLPGPAQAGFLREQRAAPEVLARVRKLLAEEDDEKPAPPPPSPIADRIGPYHLIEVLGEGSMGTVYRAEQEKPLRRTVALKVIRAGLRRPEVLERFEIERRALALMDHPNIARVLDAGETATGQPYFAMDYVAGTPIHRYCDTHALGLRQRLELLLPVCGAVEHSHQKGIIHRDLKPSNVLVAEVNGQPVPKVIDFGVARAVEGTAGGESLATQFGSLVGTLAYMSPEQAGLDTSGCDTRTDIHAVGLLAYELLAGVTPFRQTLARLEAGELSLFATLEEIRNTEPVPPSRVSAQPLPRELDWIVMKAIAKDPAERYQTIRGLAHDLRRFLDGEPVEAGPVSARYRLGKLMRRHWLPLTAAALVMLALATAAFVSRQQAIRATLAEQAARAERDRALSSERAAEQQRDRALAAEQQTRHQQQLTTEQRTRADQEAATARAVARFLQDDLLAQASPLTQAGVATPNPNLTVREALDRASVRLSQRAALPPEVRADLEDTIAGSYLDLGLFEAAGQHATQSLDLRRALGAPPEATLPSLDRQAAAALGAGQYDRAEALWKQALAAQRRLHGERSPATLATLRKLADVDRGRGRYQEAERALVQLKDLQTRQFGPTHPETLRTAGQLGFLYLLNGQHGPSENLLRQVYQARQATSGADHPETLAVLHSLARTVHYQGRPLEALPLYERGVQAAQRTLGPTHPDTLAGLMGQASCLYRLGRINESFALQTRLATLFKQVYGERHPTTLTVVHNLANHFVDVAQVDQAIELYQQTMQLQSQVLGAEHPNTLLTGYNLARALHAAGRFAPAAALFENVIEARGRVLGVQHPSLDMARSDLAGVYADLGQLERGVALGTEAWQRRRSRFGDRHFQTAQGAYWRGHALLAAGQLAEARRMVEETLSALRASNPDHYDLLDALETLGFIELRANTPLAARRVFEEARVLRRSRQGGDDPRTRRSELLVALADARLQRVPEAEAILDAWRATPFTPAWQTAFAELLSAWLHGSSARLEDAHARLAAARSSMPVFFRQEVGILCRTISGHYASQPDTAARWQARAAQWL